MTCLPAVIVFSGPVVSFSHCAAVTVIIISSGSDTYFLQYIVIQDPEPIKDCCILIKALLQFLSFPLTTSISMNLPRLIVYFYPSAKSSHFPRQIKCQMMKL